MWGRLLNRLSIIVKKNPNISLLKIGRPNSLLTVVPKNVRLPWSSLVLSRIVRLQFLSPQQAWQLWIIIESPSYLENASLRWPILTFWAFETKSSPLLFRFTSHFYLLGEGSIHNTPRSIFFLRQQLCDNEWLAQNHLERFHSWWGSLTSIIQHICCYTIHGYQGRCTNVTQNLCLVWFLLTNNPFPQVMSPHKGESVRPLVHL